MADFPALPSPSSEGVVPLPIEAFLEALDGPPHQGRKDLAELEPRLLTVDVRSPAEFEVGHIPGAVNIPLFDDEARALVGTEFKRKGRYEAIHAGLQHAGPKFARFLDALQEHGAKPGSRLLVYCWRGGMRSGSMAWLFSLCGFQVHTLQGGYRSYRRWCKTVVGANVAAPAPVLVLGGCTGAGKTAILHELRAAGQQILDLEGLAKHRGSAFGATREPQPSNEAFENILAFAVRRVSPKMPLWIEHEGRHVGKASLPVGVLSWVTNASQGALVMLSMSKDLRVRRLVDDYCTADKQDCTEQLKTCVNLLAKRLGGQRVKDAHRLLDEQRWDEVAAMMLDYYDKLYAKWAAESCCSQRIDVECPSIDAIDNARRALRAVQDVQYGQGAPAVQELESTQVPSEGAAVRKVRFEGQCHCGEVKIRCYGDARAVSYCHCSICRRLSGAPFSCQALFNAEEVQVMLDPGANLATLQTSKGVERARCASCMAPVRGLVLGGKVAAIPLGLLSSWRDDGRESPLRPMHHLYYANRVMDLRDGLPKYVGPLRSPQMPQSDW